MPIYAYRCENCGFAKDVLQKLSDPVLTDCPECGQSTFKKQLTAAGFQLKGSGWYVTDFRGGDKPPATGTAVSPGESKTADSKPAAAKSGDSAAASAAPSTPSTKSAAADSKPK